MFHKKDQTLKAGELTKRAIGKNRFTSSQNFKERWFVLKEKTLAYFEGKEEVNTKRNSMIFKIAENIFFNTSILTGCKV